MDDSRLPKIVFKWDVDLGFINSLSKSIESLFTKLDLSEKFINRQPVSINSVWALLHEEFCKNWEDNNKTMPKLRTYVKFKKVFEVEPYICFVIYEQTAWIIFSSIKKWYFTITIRSRQIDK